MAEIKLKKIKALESPVAFATDTKGRNLPVIYVDDVQIPEIKDWDVNRTYKMVVELKQTSKSTMTVGKGEERVDARFDIVAYKYLPKKEMKDMDSEEFGKYQGEVLSGKEKL